MFNIVAVIVLAVSILLLLLFVLDVLKSGLKHNLGIKIFLIAIVLYLVGARIHYDAPSAKILALDLVRLLPIAILISLLVIVLFFLTLEMLTTRTGEQPLYKEIPTFISEYIAMIQIYRIQKSRLRNDFEYCISRYEKIISKQKRKTKSHRIIVCCMNNIGWCHIENEDFPAAIRIFQETERDYINTAQDQISILCNLGYAYLKNYQTADYFSCREQLEILVNKELSESQYYRDSYNKLLETMDEEYIKSRNLN